MTETVDIGFYGKVFHPDLFIFAIMKDMMNGCCITLLMAALATDQKGKEKIILLGSFCLTLLTCSV